MKTQILKWLKETDGYLSGQELCEHFKVSRTAVWKVIKQLQEEGYQIEAVRNKGYHLVEAADVITEAEIKSRMKSQWAGTVIEYHETIDSTNIRAKKLAEANSIHGTLIVADSQKSGKGRRGRTWESPPGTGIWMSILLRPQIPPTSASMLTLVAALAVVKGIESQTGLDIQIKWPNDLVAGKKKVCGILTEMSAELDCIHYVVIGIGINVNTKEFPEEIQEVATSLRLQTGKQINRSAIIAKTMEAFEQYYKTFLVSENLAFLIEEYNNKLANCHTEVKVLIPGKEYTGLCLGIDEMGELLVQMPDNSIRKVVSGEVSVRGIYGYV